MNLTPIIFKNVDHLISEIKAHLDPKFRQGTRRIAAALLSLWKWEQNESREDCWRGIVWNLEASVRACALCFLFNARGSSYGCSNCSLHETENICSGKMNTPYKQAELHGKKQPLIDALEKAVLYEFATIYAEQCAETVRDALK